VSGPTELELPTVEEATLLHLSLAQHTLLCRGTDLWKPGDTVPPATDEPSGGGKVEDWL